MPTTWRTSCSLNSFSEPCMTRPLLSPITCPQLQVAAVADRATAHLHRGGQGAVDARPCVADLGRECLAQPVIERPQERLRHIVVRRIGDPIELVVPASERQDDEEQIL